MFNEQKAAQIAAWFLAQENGQMPHLKLMKLMYLADRASMAEHGFPMTGDRFVAMPHGPVLSMTLNHINDEATSAPDGWDSWISDKANHVVALTREVERDALDEISDADLAVLARVWKEYGWMTKYRLRDHTHDRTKFPEWEDPNGSSLPISYETVYRALGYSPEVAASLAAEVAAQSEIARELSA